jgi:hypothetical protein
MAESKGDYKARAGRCCTPASRGGSPTTPAAALAPARSRAPTRSSRKSYFRPTPLAAHARAGNGLLQVVKIRPAAPARSDLSG